MNTNPCVIHLSFVTCFPLRPLQKLVKRTFHSSPNDNFLDVVCILCQLLRAATHGYFLGLGARVEPGIIILFCIHFTDHHRPG